MNRRAFPGLEPVAVGEETQHVACEHDPAQNHGAACTNLPTIHCEFPDGADGGHYCAKHCKDAGFCYGCGQFWAGIERFDFAVHHGGIEGLCENCEDQLRSDIDEPESDDPDQRSYDESDFDGRGWDGSPPERQRSPKDLKDRIGAFWRWLRDSGWS